MKLAINGRIATDAEIEQLELERNRKELARTRHLGDKIERVAVPIARAIDKVVGTNIVGCKGCKKMKERLNTGMPLREALRLRIKGE